MQKKPFSLSHTRDKTSFPFLYQAQKPTISLTSILQLSTAAENMVKKPGRSVSRATSCGACEKNPQTAAILCLCFLRFEIIDSRYSMLLALTCLTEISSETKQACARIVVHTIHARTTNETASKRNF